MDTGKPIFFEQLEKLTLAELIESNYRYAHVLDRFGIPFYHFPQLTLQQVCQQQGLRLLPLIRSLLSLSDASYSFQQLQGLSLDLVVEYLRASHSQYTKYTLPYFIRMVNGLDSHFHSLARDFQLLVPLFAEDFIHHIHQEEDKLFYYVLQLYRAQREGLGLTELAWKMESLSIQHFASEHETHDDEMQGIRELTQQYQLPDDAPLLWRVLYAELASFEAELKAHAYIENYLLFPRALQLEAEVKEKIASNILFN
jgi:regulator of cell morphogenesis and NO signaling